MKGLLRGVNELGKRQEKGGEDLFLRSAGRPSGCGPGQQELLSPSRLKAALSFAEWGSCRACRAGAAAAHTLLWQEGTSPSTNQRGLLFSVLSLLCLAHSSVFSGHPSLGCTTCAFLHFPLSSSRSCSARICSVCLANS